MIYTNNLNDMIFLQITEMDEVQSKLTYDLGIQLINNLKSFWPNDVFLLTEEPFYALGYFTPILTSKVCLAQPTS